MKIVEYHETFTLTAETEADEHLLHALHISRQALATANTALIPYAAECRGVNFTKLRAFKGPGCLPYTSN